MARPADLLGPVAVALLFAGCDGVLVPERPAGYEFRGPAQEVFHWPPDRLPVRVYVPAAGRLPEFVTGGLRLWERQFLYGEFRGEVVSDSASADVIVALQGTLPADAVPTGTVPAPGTCAPAQTLIPAATGGMLTDVVRIVLRVPAGASAATVADCLVLLAAHEIGHALGILRESDGDDDLMNTNPRTATPSARDRATAQELYHVAPTLRPRPRPE